MSAMAEKVARAICAATTKADPDEIVYICDIGDHQECDARYRAYIPEARAAIEAMREPDAKMLNAACAAMSPGKRPTPKRVSVKAKHGIRYRAMIDEALK